MYMSGRVGNEPRGPDAIIDIAPLPPRATIPAPSSGSSARSAGSPPAPMLAPAPKARPPLRGADHDVPVDRKLLERLEHARARGLLRASSSARPSQRALARADRSVTRA